VAAGTDCVAVVTARAYLLRYDFSQGTTPGARCGVASARADCGAAPAEAVARLAFCARSPAKQALAAV